MTRTSGLRAVRRPVPVVACLPAIATAITTAILAAIVTASGAAALDEASPPLSARPSAGLPSAGAGSRLLRMLAGEAPGQPPPAGPPERSGTAAASTQNATIPNSTAQISATPDSTAPYSGAPNPAGAASVIEGCPRAVLTRLLAGAARREDALSALAIEHETLKLCRERQTIVTGIFETEARLRALRAPAEPAAATGNWSPVPTVPTVPAALPQLRPPPARPAPKPATPAPAPPRYGWFSIVGMAGALRAGVTDGRRVWFVREGDPLPGDVRVGRIAARPPGVHIEGVRIEGGDEGALPYRARPGGGS